MLKQKKIYILSCISQNRKKIYEEINLSFLWNTSPCSEKNHLKLAENAIIDEKAYLHYQKQHFKWVFKESLMSYYLNLFVAILFSSISQAVLIVLALKLIF